MLAAAIIDWWKFKVPNKLTFPLIFSGWLLGLANNFGLGAGEGGIGAALAGTVLGFLLLLPVYCHRRHGRRRRQDDHGLRLVDRRLLRQPRSGPWILIWRLLCGAIVGGVIALGMILVRGHTATTPSTCARSSATCSSCRA